MKKGLILGCATVTAATVLVGARLLAHDEVDFGLFVQRELNARSEQLFGVGRPLSESALGPYTAADSTQAIQVARGLSVSLVSSAVHASTDMIALWPDNDNPKYL